MKKCTLKTTVNEDLAPDLLFRRFVLITLYLVAAGLLIILIIAGQGIIEAPRNATIALIILIFITVFSANHLNNFLKRSIIKKADRIIVKILRPEIIRLLKSYFGERRLFEHSKVTGRVFSQIRNNQLCYFKENKIEIASTIEFDRYASTFQQNEGATTLKSFNISPEGKLTMCYMINYGLEEHHFPLS